MRRIVFFLALALSLNVNAQFEISTGFEQIKETFSKSDGTQTNYDYNGVIQAAYFLSDGMVGLKPFVNARLGDYNNVKAGVLLEFRLDLFPYNEDFGLSVVPAAGLMYDGYLGTTDYTAQPALRIDYKNFFLQGEYSVNVVETINYSGVGEARIFVGYQF